MNKTRLLSLLMLLMTAVTGTWAQSAKHKITVISGFKKVSMDQPLPYTTSIDEVFKSQFSVIPNSYDFSITGVSVTSETDVITIGEFNGWKTPVCVTADGKATINVEGNDGNRFSFIISVIPPYHIDLENGTRDADKWTVKVGTGDAKPLPVGGLSETDAVTLNYSGHLKVKGVKATVDAEKVFNEGKFSISNSKKVNFAKGNLQATSTDNGANWTWAFAEHQWDFIGNAAANTSINGNGTINGSGTVDLFGWVGSSNETWSGAAQYGISKSNVTNNVDGYGNSTSDVLKSDWGKLIGDGKTWRTLTIDEWLYVIDQRHASFIDGTEDGRYAKATVNGVAGIILFPDLYVHPSGLTTPTKVNDSGANFNVNQYDATAWGLMEQCGCIFLPAAGSRRETVVNINPVIGRYWSCSPSNDNTSIAHAFIFNDISLSSYDDGGRHFGFSVRLVKDAE